MYTHNRTSFQKFSHQNTRWRNRIAYIVFCRRSIQLAFNVGNQNVRIVNGRINQWVHYYRYCFSLAIVTSVLRRDRGRRVRDDGSRYRRKITRGHRHCAQTAHFWTRITEKRQTFHPLPARGDAPGHSIEVGCTNCVYIILLLYLCLFFYVVIARLGSAGDKVPRRRRDNRWRSKRARLNLYKKKKRITTHQTGRHFGDCCVTAASSRPAR